MGINLMYDATALSKLPQTDLGIMHHFSDAVYAKQMHLPAGHVAMSHKHAYSHLSVLAAGKCIVTTIGADGEEVAKEYQSPACIDIKAGVEHQIEAVEDVDWFCIHATQETDPAKIDEVAIASIHEA